MDLPKLDYFLKAISASKVYFLRNQEASTFKQQPHDVPFFGAQRYNCKVEIMKLMTAVSKRWII
jgi:hypothetical protein